MREPEMGEPPIRCRTHPCKVLPLAVTEQPFTPRRAKSPGGVRVKSPHLDGSRTQYAEKRVELIVAYLLRGWRLRVHFILLQLRRQRAPVQDVFPTPAYRERPNEVADQNGGNPVPRVGRRWTRIAFRTVAAHQRLHERPEQQECEDDFRSETNHGLKYIVRSRLVRLQVFVFIRRYMLLVEIPHHHQVTDRPQRPIRRHRRPVRIPCSGELQIQ
jgi:hypothetical protein